MANRASLHACNGPALGSMWMRRHDYRVRWTSSVFFLIRCSTFWWSHHHSDLFRKMGKGKAGGGRHAPADSAGLTRRTAVSKAGGADKDATEVVVEAKPLWSSGGSQRRALMCLTLRLCVGGGEGIR